MFISKDWVRQHVSGSLSNMKGAIDERILGVEGKLTQYRDQARQAYRSLDRRSKKYSERVTARFEGVDERIDTVEEAGTRNSERLDTVQEGLDATVRDVAEAYLQRYNFRLADVGEDEQSLAELARGINDSFEEISYGEVLSFIRDAAAGRATTHCQHGMTYSANSKVGNTLEVHVVTTKDQEDSMNPAAHLKRTIAERLITARQGLGGWYEAGSHMHKGSEYAKEIKVLGNEGRDVVISVLKSNSGTSEQMRRILVNEHFTTDALRALYMGAVEGRLENMTQGNDPNNIRDVGNLLSKGVTTLFIGDQEVDAFVAGIVRNHPHLAEYIEEQT